MKSAILVAMAGFPVFAAAQPVVIPAAFATSGGGVTPSDTLTREFARTHQQVISAAHLAAIPSGSSITQLTLRASNFGTLNPLGSWPPVSLTYTTFDIYLARAARSPGSMSTTFSDNVIPGTEVRVRSGALTIPAGAFSNFVALPGANPWGLDIQLAPFPYTGGDLILTIRHSGHQTPLTPRLYTDSLINTASGMQSIGAPGVAATTGSAEQGQPAIVRVRYIPPAGCYVNCDGSTGSPSLTANDFMCFFNCFSTDRTKTPADQVTSYANCDGSTAHPVLNIGDFVCFNSRFAAGCN